MKDSYGREIDYMRISVTDRCDLRCRYCIPDGCEKTSMDNLLTYEEIIRICKVSSGLGIKKIKITGGEPFVRKGSVGLMREIKQIEGIEQVTVTTNGQTLDRYIDELKDIGIDGINISLDSLDHEKFRYITGGGDLEKTLCAVSLAAGSGIRTKVNCLLQKGVNEDEAEGLAALTEEYGVDVRFIEMMPIGAGDANAGVSNEYVLGRLKEIWPDLAPDGSVRGNGPARYYKRPGAKGAVGFISAMHGIFCSECNRVRLTSTGRLKPCLCYDSGTDIKPVMGESDEVIAEAISSAIVSKPEAHCFLSSGFADESGMETRLMSQIGG